MSDLKNSTFNQNGRYVVGGTTEVSSTSIKWWEKRSLEKDSTDVFYTIEKKFEGRADLIAFAFYGDDSLWWLVCQYNSILNPIDEIVEGIILRIPNPSRIQKYKNGTTTGGVQVK